MKIFNKKNLFIYSVIIVSLVFTGINRPVNSFFKSKETKMKITSTFANEEKIPSAFTCDGQNISPELIISKVPAQTKSLAIIVDDPDAPAGTFTHWVLYNIPPNTHKIDSKNLPKESLQGINDFGQIGYGGPCPPSGTHRYFFKLYALDNIIPKKRLIKTQLEQEIEGHIIAQSELIGKYSRK